MQKEQMGYQEALGLTLETVSPLDSEYIGLGDASDRIVSEDLYAKVDSPSVDASMKDGYAIRSEEIAAATSRHPVRLTVIDMATAGNPALHAVTGGSAIRIQTGARIPEGADAVLAEEFATRDGETLTVFNHAHRGRNILPRGADIEAGEMIATKGSRLSPGMIGMLAAGGFGTLPAYRRPRPAILATGDELVVPGQPLGEGKLYASNLEMLKAWCVRYGMPPTFQILGDKPAMIGKTIERAVATGDAVITSGGAWSGDRDFVAYTLASLGWKKRFHWIRIGPGKAVGFGLLNHKPVFLLPGGPPSNLTAFLQIALPGLLRLAGHNDPSLPGCMVKLSRELTGRQIDWTEFVYGTLTAGERHTRFTPLSLTSRLKSMAGAEAVVAIPEGVTRLPAGTITTAQRLV